MELVDTAGCQGLTGCGFMSFSCLGLSGLNLIDCGCCEVGGGGGGGGRKCSCGQTFTFGSDRDPGYEALNAQ